jgi:hypothetical protein
MKPLELAYADCRQNAPGHTPHPSPSSSPFPLTTVTNGQYVCDEGVTTLEAEKFAGKLVGWECQSAEMTGA